MRNNASFISSAGIALAGAPAIAALCASIRRGAIARPTLRGGVQHRACSLDR